MKKILLISSIILLTASFSLGQSRSLNVDGGGSIVRFYPNPATSLINFDFAKTPEKGYTLQLFSFLGKKMSEVNHLSQHTRINLSDFSRGVYIYQLFDRTGKLVESGKFQVSK